MSRNRDFEEFVQNPPTVERQLEDDPQYYSAADAVARFALAVAAAEPPPDLDDLPTLPPKYVELVLDRLDAGLREGRCELTAELYARVLETICPDEFVLPPLPAPTDVPPGGGGNVKNQSQRVAVYAARCRMGLRIFHEQDASGDQDRRGIRPFHDGTHEPKTGGWQDE